MLNENIRKYRKECGLSQEEMAVKLHVVRQTISKWETNLSVPDADMLVEIAKVLQVSVEQLLDYSGKDSLALDTELARLNEELAKHIKEGTSFTALSSKTQSDLISSHCHAYHCPCRKKHLLVYRFDLTLCFGKPLGFISQFSTLSITNLLSL